MCHRTALHMAASWNKGELVQALLAAGANPLAADVNGMTALHLASLFGDVQSAQALVATGKVDVNEMADTTLGGMVPLDCALECDRPESVELWDFLRNQGASPNYTRDVQQHPHPFPSQKVTPFIGFLMSLAKNTDVASGDDESETALNKVQMLLKAGANPNDVDSFGRSALCYTVGQHMTEILVQAGADVNSAAPAAKMAEYARHVAGATHANIIQNSMVQMVGVVRMTGSDRETTVKRIAEVAAKHSATVQAAYRRTLYSSSPLAEALAEGKLEKATALIAAGAVASIDLAGAPDPVVLDRSNYLPPQDDKFQQLRAQFGGIHWDGLAVPLLQMSAASAKVSAPAMRGGLLLKAQHVVTIVKARNAISHVKQLLQTLGQAESVLPPLDGSAGQQYDAVAVSPGDVLRLQSACGKVFDALPKSLSAGLSGSSLAGGVSELDLSSGTGSSSSSIGGGAEDAAAAHTMQQEADFRTRTNTAGKVQGNEDWSSYRTRTMSFKRATSNSAQNFDE